MRITNGGRIGVANTNPQSMLHLGNCEVPGSAPVFVFGKNNAGNGFRNAFMGYTENFFFVIGDYGNANAGSNALTSQLAILYSAPASSLVIQGSGYTKFLALFQTAFGRRKACNMSVVLHLIPTPSPKLIDRWGRERCSSHESESIKGEREEKKKTKRASKRNRKRRILNVEERQRRPRDAACFCMCCLMNQPFSSGGR